jgi:hypothetical protein
MKTKVLVAAPGKAGVTPGQIYAGDAGGVLLAIHLNNFNDDDFAAIRNGEKILFVDLGTGRLVYGDPAILRTELRPVGGTLELERAR